jgi:hypothetical protein
MPLPANALELDELMQQQQLSLQKSLFPLMVAAAAVVSDDGDMINDVGVDIGNVICCLFADWLSTLSSILLLLLLAEIELSFDKRIP